MVLKETQIFREICDSLKVYKPTLKKRNCYNGISLSRNQNQKKNFQLISLEAKLDYRIE